MSIRKKAVSVYNRIKPVLEQEGEIHYTRVAVLTGIGPSYAIQLCQAIPLVIPGVKYERGVLYATSDND